MLLLGRNSRRKSEQRKINREYLCSLSIFVVCLCKTLYCIQITFALNVQYFFYSYQIQQQIANNLARCMYFTHFKRFRGGFVSYTDESRVLFILYCCRNTSLAHAFVLYPYRIVSYRIVSYRIVSHRISRIQSLGEFNSNTVRLNCCQCMRHTVQTDIHTNHI